LNDIVRPIRSLVYSIRALPCFEKTLDMMAVLLGLDEPALNKRKAKTRTPSKT